MSRGFSSSRSYIDGWRGDFPNRSHCGESKLFLALRNLLKTWRDIRKIDKYISYVYVPARKRVSRRPGDLWQS